MSLLDKIEIPRKTLVLFFVIDTSGSMEGSRISALNTAIRELLSEIGEVSDENADVQIEIAVLGFSSGAHWITANGPVEVSRFNWTDLEAAGTTDFGAACRVLNEKLSTKAFMEEGSVSFAPIIFLTMDGEPTDEWENALAELKQNNWFKVAIKIAIPIGDDVNRDVLKEFTGNTETVLETHNLGALKKIIRFNDLCDPEATVEEPSNADTDEQKKEQIEQLIAALSTSADTGVEQKLEKDNLTEAKKKLEEGDYAHAIMLLEDLALNHNAESFYLLGQCYAFSLGVPNYEQIANECYSMAKKLGWNNFEKTCEHTSIYFLIDASDNTENLRDNLNEFMNKIITALHKWNNEHLFWSKFKIQAMAFSDTIRWYKKNSDVIDISEFQWRIPKIGGKVNWENLWSALNEKIDKIQKNNHESKRKHLFLIITNNDIPDELGNNINPIEENASFSGEIVFALSDLDSENEQIKSIQHLSKGAKENTNKLLFTLGSGSAWGSCSVDRFIYEFGMPSSFPEWIISSISDSMKDIDDEIKEFIDYLRE